MSHTPTKMRSINGDVQKLYMFPNKYGASVVRHQFSYGYKDGLWELAVLKCIGEKGSTNYQRDWKLCYDTPITGDVMGYLSDSKVESLLDQIAALPPPHQTSLASSVIRRHP